MIQEIQPIQYRTVSDSVYGWIKDAIVNGTFQPGEHIAQERLTELLGVSRTPVRDAMKRLEAEGLVVNKPHCGVVVFDATEEQLLEIYEIRILLEQYCAAKACLLATDEQIDKIEADNSAMRRSPNTSRQFMTGDRNFHRDFCMMSGCASAIEILENLWNRCEAFKAIYYSIDGKADSTLEEHAHIIQAFRDRDVETVKAVINSHLQDVVQTTVLRLRAEQRARAAESGNSPPERAAARGPAAPV